MADQQDRSDSDPGSDSCLACRGTGSVVSNLGGKEQSVDCPWCEGKGKRIPEHDAQARFRKDE